MRKLFTAGTVVAVLALCGCQQSSTTSSTTTSSSAGAAATTPPAASTPAVSTPAAPATGTTADLGKAEKSMDVMQPDGHTATLHYTDLKVGDGSIADGGMSAQVNYTGWLLDGTKFDSSLDRGVPFAFHIGAVPPEVIAGWDQGVRGMRVGGKRKLVIPPELGYGPRGAGGVIPPNATLVFEVELVGLR